MLQGGRGNVLYPLFFYGGERSVSDYIKNELSQKIYRKMHSSDSREQEVMVDPATLMLIAKISIAVIKAIKACKESADDRETIVRKPSLANEGVLKSIVRKKLGWWKYFIIGKKIISAMKEMGTEVDHNDLNQSGLFDDLSEGHQQGVFKVWDGNRYYEL